MRAETKLFLGLGIFMVPLGVIYAIVGHYTSGVEIAGTLLLLIVAVAFAFIGIYLGIQAKRLPGLRPEDYDASPSDGAGHVGDFSTASIWPLLGASGLTLAGFGMAFTNFLYVPGFAILFVTVIGMARETEISELGYEPLDSAGHPEAKPIQGLSDNVAK